MSVCLQKKRHKLLGVVAASHKVAEFVAGQQLLPCWRFILFVSKLVSSGTLLRGSVFRTTSGFLGLKMNSSLICSLAFVSMLSSVLWTWHEASGESHPLPLCSRQAVRSKLLVTTVLSVWSKHVQVWRPPSRKETSKAKRLVFLHCKEHAGRHTHCTAFFNPGQAIQYRWLQS